jgi:hypothetical protein
MLPLILCVAALDLSVLALAACYIRRQRQIARVRRALERAIYREVA